MKKISLVIVVLLLSFTGCKTNPEPFNALTTQQINAIKQYLPDGPNVTLDISPEKGTVSYFNKDADFDTAGAMIIDKAQALALAENHLKEMGLLPPSSTYKTDVSGVSATPMDVYAGTFGEQQTLAYTVKIFCSINDESGKEEEEDINIVITNKGIVSLDFNWN